MPTIESPIRVPRLLRVREVAAITGLERFRVYAAIRDGGMPHLRVGKTYRVPEDALARWIAEQAAESVR
jgi:excisionase family DNA binding protein